MNFILANEIRYFSALQKHFCLAAKNFSYLVQNYFKSRAFADIMAETPNTGWNIKKYKTLKCKEFWYI